MTEFREEWRELEGEMVVALEETFPDVRATVRKNLAALVIGLVLRTPRGWYGRLSLSGVSRALPTRGEVSARYKRLHRFLDDPRFDNESFSAGLLRLATGARCPSLVPVLVDQTALGEVQVLTASYPVEGRAIPLATATFEHSQLDSSQNLLEEGFLRRLAGALPGELRLVWIMDRGYARAAVIVEYHGQRLSLGRLPHRQGQACRYRGVLYQGREKAAVDIIVYREKGFKEPWFLLVPVDSEEILPTDTVVQLYRSRMQMEVSFRDFKSWLGVRGLRLNRLLTGLAMGYVLLLVLGTSRLAQQLRREIEGLRRPARHGTRRTLSSLSLALMVVADPLLLSFSNLTQLLKSSLQTLRSGQTMMAQVSV